MILAILHRILELGRGQEASGSSADSHGKEDSPRRLSSGDGPASTVHSTEAMNTDNPATATATSGGPVAMEMEGQASEAAAATPDSKPSGPVLSRCCCDMTSIIV